MLIIRYPDLINSSGYNCRITEHTYEMLHTAINNENTADHNFSFVKYRTFYFVIYQSKPKYPVFLEFFQHNIFIIYIDGICNNSFASKKKNEIYHSLLLK